MQPGERGRGDLRAWGVGGWRPCDRADGAPSRRVRREQAAGGRQACRARSRARRRRAASKAYASSSSQGSMTSTPTTTSRRASPPASGRTRTTGRVARATTPSETEPVSRPATRPSPRDQHQRIGVLRGTHEGDGSGPVGLHLVHPYVRQDGVDAFRRTLQDPRRKAAIDGGGGVRTAALPRVPPLYVQQPQGDSTARGFAGGPFGGREALGGPVDTDDYRRLHGMHLSLGAFPVDAQPRRGRRVRGGPTGPGTRTRRFRPRPSHKNRPPGHRGHSALLTCP